MNNSPKKKKNKFLVLRLIFIIVLISANTFAWFIYATRVDNNISVHVKSWNVLFEAGDNLVTDTVSVNVDSIYPGMTDYSYQITTYNRSEVSASLSYTLLEASILGDEYVTVEGRSLRNEQVGEDDLTSAQLLSKLQNDYPFAINVSVSNSVISESNGREYYTISVVWPYESNNDELDTTWGIRAAEYEESNPGEPSITLTVKIIITQNAS